MGKKLLPYLIALSAAAVSASAAFYSVTGLMKLFAGASVAVGIMASALEISKLVIASLLYQYWNTINKVLRIYLVIAAAVLMAITSIGIYGFLSAAYQKTASQDEIITQKVTILETKKKLLESQRDNLYKEKQTAAEYRNSLSKSTTTQYTDGRGNLIVRSNNANYKQLEAVNATDSRLSSKLENLNDSIYELESKLTEARVLSVHTSELGPLKYIAELSGTSMNIVVNWLLLTIIFVFDPLAIALVIAANFAFTRPKQRQPLEDEVEGMRKVVQAYDTLVDEVEEHVAETAKTEVDPIEEVISDGVEELEPKSNLNTIQQDLEASIEEIRNNQNYSEWKKKQLIEESIRRSRQSDDGKRYW